MQRQARLDLYIENCLGVSFPVLPFAFIMQERSTEGIHAFATKLYKRSPHAGPSCLSVELKWDNVERMVQKQGPKLSMVRWVRVWGGMFPVFLCVH